MTIDELKAQYDKLLDAHEVAIKQMARMERQLSFIRKCLNDEWPISIHSPGYTVERIKRQALSMMEDIA